MLDDRTCTRTVPHPYAGQQVWTAEYNHFGWSSYLGGAPGKDNVPDYAAAARAENLAGLPPAFVSVGALDLFLDEDLDYVRRLSYAGVSVEFHLYPGTFHGFDLAIGTRIAAQANRDSVEALRRSFESKIS